MEAGKNHSSGGKTPLRQKLFARLLREYVTRHLKTISVAVTCMIVAAGSTAGLAWMMQPVLDKIFVEKNGDLLLPVAIGIVALSLAKGIATYAYVVIMRTISQRVASDMQMDLFRHLLKSDISLFNDNSSGSLISRFTNDINLLRNNITTILAGIVKEPLTLISLILVMFVQNVQLALIAFFIFPLAIYPVVWLGRQMRKVSTRTQETLGQLTSVLDDSFQGIRIVKAYGQEEAEMLHTRDIIEKTVKLYSKAARIASASSPIMETLGGIAVAAIVAYGGAQVLSGATTPGAFFSFVTALIMAYKPMKTISALNNGLQESMAAIVRHYNVMDTEPAIRNLPGAKPLSLENKTIKFNNVTFGYGSDARVLENINFDIPEGKRVALVGHSGGGKSTIMNLILRFYDPSGGNITIGGEDIKQATLESLRSSIAIVTQETTLFDSTVAENIAYGKTNASRQEIEEAAKSAAADEFIRSLPEGYDTLIGQRGVRLSGGQRQRIAIARAMLKNAPILLLDEATSALDTVSEQLIQQALEKLMTGRTSLVIAHRLSTIKNSDIIYVVRSGRIVEKGSHETLLKKGGEYSDLYNRQFGKQEQK